VSEAFEILEGDSDSLIVVDHASNHVPNDINLGVDLALLQEHIAWDIGVAEIARALSAQYNHPAILGSVSRLVTDYNRYPEEADVMPPLSDGIEISGNNINQTERAARMERFFNPYHAKLGEMLDMQRPKFALFLHSYTPALMSKPDMRRPWDVGILYNEDDRAAKLALEFLSTLSLAAKSSLNVGDQLPYTGLIYNATMVRQAEARGIPYFCFEIRQDHIADAAGVEKWTGITCQLITHIVDNLED